MKVGKFYWLFVFLGLLCLLGFLISCTSKETVKVLELTITSPQNNPGVDDKPLTVKGTIRFTGDFSKKYGIWLYKNVSGGLYWQQCNATITGNNWEGVVWPQETGFSPAEMTNGFKKEGVKAFVYERSKEKQLPGYGNPGGAQSSADVEKALPANIGINQSLTADFRNLYPARR